MTAYKQETAAEKEGRRKMLLQAAQKALCGLTITHRRKEWPN